MKIISLVDKLGLYIVNQVVRRPSVALISCLLLVASVSPGLSNLSIAVDHRAFFGPDNPQLIAYDEIEENYSKVDNIIFAIRTDGEPAIGPKTYPIIQFITENAWQLPSASRVDSLSNYQHTRAEGDDLIVEYLLDEGVEFSAHELKNKEAIALAEPLLNGNIISSDAETSGVNVVALFGEDLDGDISAFVDAARALALEAEEKFPGTEIALTGSAVMSKTFMEAGQGDAQTLIPGMYLILLLALGWVYRSGTAVLSTFAVVTASTIVPLGIMGYLNVQLTSLSLIAPIIIMTLAVADSVHILVTQLNLMRSGIGKIDALRESMRINFLAVSVTSITTIIGFLCLNFSDTPPYQHLGNLSAVGILSAWLFSVVLLPALIILLPMKTAVRQAQTSDLSQRGMRDLAHFTTTRYKLILPISLILCAGLISQLPKLELNDQFVEFFDKSIAFRSDTDFIQEHLGGAFYIHYDIQSGKANGINDPSYLKSLERFTNWLRDQPLVTSVYSFSDIAKRLNRNMHEDQAAFYRVPEDQELAAQYLLLYELSLPYGLDLTDRVNSDKSGTRLTVAIDNPTAKQMREFSDQSRTWLNDNVVEVMRGEPTGTSLLFSHISQRNIDSMLYGNIIAILAIALILILALEHIGLGILSMLPNVLPVALALSLWAIISGVAGMATTVVAASSLGIVVDNTTHFLSKYLRARREKGKDKKEAIAYSFETVGIAIIANGFVLICGFAILAFSNFQPNFQMGLLTAITIALALIVDLICLPALLMLGGDRNKQTPS